MTTADPAPRLLVRLGSMGDVVLATAAANALRELWGPGSVDVLVKDEWAPLWRNHPAVRNVLCLGRRDRAASGLLVWAPRLRKSAYQEVYDLQASTRTRVLLSLAGYRAVRRPRRETWRRRFLVRYRRWGPPGSFRVVDAYVGLVIPKGRALPSLHPGREAQERAAEIIPSRGTVLGLAPGARHDTKRWPITRFIELGRRWVEAGMGPVPVFFGPGDEAVLAAWRVHWPGDGTWTPVREGLETAAAALGRLAGLVTNDSGLMHAAAAMGTPVAALFGPTVREFGFAPAGEGHRILEITGLDCRPCSLHGGPHCPRKHFRCMLDLSVDAVAEAARALPRRPPAESTTTPR